MTDKKHARNHTGELMGVESLQFTAEQKAAWRVEFAPKATDSQWQIFIDECARRALIPGTHVIFSLRDNSEYDAALQDWVKVKKVAFMTTINALRLIAKRDGKYRGRGGFTFFYQGADALESTEIPRGTIPHAVRCEFYHKDWDKSLPVVARFDAYVQKKRNGEPTSMWEKRGEEQLAKCCEAQGLREIAPEECGGLYIKEELENEEPVMERPAPAPSATPVAPPSPAVTPAVNQEPAKETPKKNPAPEASEPKEPTAQTTTAPTPTPAPSQPDRDSAAPTTAPAPETTKPSLTETPKSAEAKTEGTSASSPEPDRLPNANEFSMFGARATKLMRETLPKAGIKNAAAALQAYMAKGTGEKNTKKYTVNQWETLLFVLENAPPDAVAKFIKGEK